MRTAIANSVVPVDWTNFVGLVQWADKVLTE
jgi:hypothetical protein